jgi:chloramphenicol O-acetyltransferase type A
LNEDQTKGTTRLKIEIDVTTWERRELLAFFRNFDEPFHGVCVRVDCTATYQFAKQYHLSVFLSMLHRSLAAAQQVENFRTTIEGDKVWRYDQVDGGSAVSRPNGTIGFGYYRYQPNLEAFVLEASKEWKRVEARTDLARSSEPNVIRYSVLPWLDFTSISHARQLGKDDSSPRITFGKMTETAGRRSMPVSLHVHHGLLDGLQVAQYLEHFQAMLNRPA